MAGGAGTAGVVAGTAGASIAAIGAAIPGQASKKGKIVAQSLFAASAAANAIPVAGQFVSAGLAIAGLFTKLFAGKRKRKREEREAARKKQLATASNAIKAGAQADISGGIGQGSGRGPAGTTAPLQGPAVPAFSSYGGGPAPSIQPAQQVINSSLGFK